MTRYFHSACNLSRSFVCSGRPLRRSRPAVQHFCAVPQVISPLAGNSIRPRQFQAREPQQIVSPGDEVAPGLRPLASAIAAAPQSAHRLDPTNDFLHPFADELADVSTTVSSTKWASADDLHAALSSLIRRMNATKKEQVLRSTQHFQALSN